MIRRENGHVYTQRKHRRKTREGDDHLRAKKKGIRIKPALLTPWPWTSSLQNVRKSRAVVSGTQYVAFVVRAPANFYTRVAAFTILFTQEVGTEGRGAPRPLRGETKTLSEQQQHPQST